MTDKYILGSLQGLRNGFLDFMGASRGLGLEGLCTGLYRALQAFTNMGFETDLGSIFYFQGSLAST